MPTALWGESSAFSYSHYSFVHSYSQQIFTEHLLCTLHRGYIHRSKALPLWSTGSVGCLVTSLSVSSFSRAGVFQLMRAGQSRREMSSVMRLAVIGPKAPSKWLLRASSLMTYHLSSLLPSGPGGLLMFFGAPSQDKGQWGDCYSSVVRPCPSGSVIKSWDRLYTHVPPLMPQC